MVLSAIIVILCLVQSLFVISYEDFSMAFLIRVAYRYFYEVLFFFSSVPLENEGTDSY